METNYSTLYKKSKDGKIKSWSISVITNENVKPIVRIITGFIGKKMTIFDLTINIGKNIGKSNETSVYAQALEVSNSKLNSKLNSGYTTDQSGISDNVLTLPMLAQSYTEHHSKIKFGAFYQPKLDGVRALYQFKNNQLHSRGLKIFPHLEHILKELKGVDTSINLDGELYSDILTFQEISGIVRKVKLNKKDIEMVEKIQYRVYDIISPLNYEERLLILKKFFKSNNFKSVFLVETKVIESHDDIKQIHDNLVKKGYEGMILRNKLGGYEIDKRSYNLQKIKLFDDAEFEIVNFKDGTGKEEKAVIWICITKEGKTFAARPIGSISERKKAYKIADKSIGKMMTIRHFGFTEEKIPRFPIAYNIRESGY